MIELIYTLITTHITIICVTLYLHRGQAHKAIEFHPALAHFMRFWLWLTTGMTTKEWVAVHRKHHRYSDVNGDPHSPAVESVLKILFGGVWYYRRASQDRAMVDAYGAGTPDDQIEQKLYTPHPWLGILLLLVIDLVLFGPVGIVVWGVQVLWIPFWAAGVVNGVAHWIGYRNGTPKDCSRNISPWGIIIGGEELHGNHHLEPASPKMSIKWWEFDIGWMWLCIFKFLHLAKLRT